MANVYVFYVLMASLFIAGVYGLYTGLIIWAKRMSYRKMFQEFKRSN